MNVTCADLIDLEKIIRSGQTFRATCGADGCCHFIHRGRLLHCRQLDGHTLAVDCSPTTWQRHWAPYFDLTRNYSALLQNLPAGDDFLRRAVTHGLGLRLLRQDPWEMLISFILSQRKSIPAIRTSIEALCALCGSPLRAAPMLHAFPTPRQIARASADTLARCGMGYRLPYVQAAAQRLLAEPQLLAQAEALPDEALDGCLQSFYGVGEKVANCIMLFGYGRTGRAPVDVWIQRIIAGPYGGRAPFANWGEAAGIYQQFLFFYALHGGLDAQP